MLVQMMSTMRVSPVRWDVCPANSSLCLGLPVSPPPLRHRVPQTRFLPGGSLLSVKMAEGWLAPGGRPVHGEGLHLIPSSLLPAHRQFA